MSEKRTGSLFLNGRRAGRQIAGRAKPARQPDAREGEEEKGKLRKVNGTLMLKIAGAVVFCLVLAWLASMDILKDVHECEWNDTITAEEKPFCGCPVLV